MTKVILKNLLFAAIICLISFIITILAYPHLEEELVFVSSTALSKEKAAFILPILTLAAGFLLSFLPLFYQLIAKEEKLVNPNSYRNIIVISCSTLLFMQIFALCSWLDYHVSLYNLCLACFGFILLLIGNFMPRFKKGMPLAIYNPWTMSNPKIWRKTHRFGGYVWLISGLATIFMILVPKDYNLWLVLLFFILCLLLPNIYAYFYHRYLIKRKKDA